MRRIFFHLLLIAVALLGSAAYAGAQEIAVEITKPVKIEFWHAMNGGNETALRAIVDKFNAENKDGITVDLVYQGHYRDLFAKLEGAAKAGNLPALSMIFPNRLTAYVLSDLAECLDPYLENEKTKFDPAIWNDIPPFLRDNGTWDGKHFSLPFNKAPFLLFYNIDLLEKYGVKPPKTWDELAEAAKKLTLNDGGKDIVGLALNNSLGIDSSFWVEQAGGHIYDEAKDEITFNQKPGVDAYRFLAGMIKSGIAKRYVEERYITGPFTRGEAAMAVSFMYVLPDLIEGVKETGVRFSAVPVPNGVAKATCFTGTDVAIFNTPSPEEKLAAFKFLKFFYEFDSQLAWGTASGFLPLTWNVINSKEFKSYCEKNDVAKLAAIETFEYGMTDPKILNGYAIHDNMSKALDRVLLEDADIQTALDEAAAQARKEIEQSRAAFQTIK